MHPEEDHPQHPEQPPARTEETIAERFPDRGEFPGNEVRPDPDAEPAPNHAHPE